MKIKLLLKTLIGLGLLAWVLQSRMVDFTLLQNLVFSPLNLATAFFFLVLSSLFCTARWLILARAQGLQLDFKDLFSLTMIGNFFNTFMPGSVGGDVMKAWYIAGKEPQKRTKAVFTVLFDRVLGLSVIISYAAFTLVFFSHWLAQRPQLQAVALSVWVFTLIFITGALVFFFPPFWKTSVLKKLLAFIRKSKKLSHLVESTLLYQNHGKQLFLALLLSAFSILSSNYFYFYEGNLLSIPLSLVQYFVIVPLAVTASAVPLLPGGIGTGQVAFFTLFKWMGVENPEQGATLCTLVQIYTLLFNCLGYFFYLRFKRVPTSPLLSTHLERSPL
jgi:uncharacterized protein (TIRG00374 family)